MSETISLRFAQENDNGQNLDRNADAIRSYESLSARSANQALDDFADPSSQAAGAPLFQGENEQGASGHVIPSSPEV
jgi:hypothetical protein